MDKLFFIILGDAAVRPSTASTILESRHVNKSLDLTQILQCSSNPILRADTAILMIKLGKPEGIGRPYILDGQEAFRNREILRSRLDAKGIIVSNMI